MNNDEKSELKRLIEQGIKRSETPKEIVKCLTSYGYVESTIRKYYKALAKDYTPPKDNRIFTTTKRAR